MNTIFKYKIKTAIRSIVKSLRSRVGGAAASVANSRTVLPASCPARYHVIEGASTSWAPLKASAFKILQQLEVDRCG